MTLWETNRSRPNEAIASKNICFNPFCWRFDIPHHILDAIMFFDTMPPKSLKIDLISYRIKLWFTLVVMEAKNCQMQDLAKMTFSLCCIFSISFVYLTCSEYIQQKIPCSDVNDFLLSGQPKSDCFSYLMSDIENNFWKNLR